MSTTLTADDVELTIDEEFDKVLDPPTEAERDALRSDIEREGRFRDSLKYWRENGHCLIVDGTQRFRLWQGLPDDTPIPPPRVEEVLYPDRAAVVKAIKSGQVGRRNLPPKRTTAIITELYGKRKRNSAGRPKSAKNGRNKNGRTNATISGRASGDVANQTGVHRATVHRASAYETSLAAIKAVNGKAASDIESGSLKVSKNVVTAVGKLDKDGIVSALKNLRAGRKWDHAEATEAVPDAPVKPLAAFQSEKHIKAVGTIMRALDDVKAAHGAIKEYLACLNAARALSNGLTALGERLAK